ncbi:MAG TPA: hypothetical protein VGO92_10140 [Acidimicrobiales bacterium]|nr:hypothetical protein [Acidimicrobiales bacterium]
MAHPPWHLSGELVVAWVARRPGRRTRLPVGVAPLPGPAVVVALSYADSPVGPFLELSVGEPARIGLRPGFCVTTCVVATPDSRVDYKMNWGVPAELGAMVWEVDGQARRLTWLDRGVVVEGRAHRWRVPAMVPGRSVQRRSDGVVVVPRRVRGWLGLGRAVVHAPEGDPLSWAEGGHPGGVMTGMRMVVSPARHPFGLLSTLRAPLQAPAPGGGLTASSLLGPRGAEAVVAAASVIAPRAYGSVG